MIKRYNIALQKEEIELILKVLSEKPFNLVAPIITELAKQLQGQIKDGDDK